MFTKVLLDVIAIAAVGGLVFFSAKKLNLSVKEFLIDHPDTNQIKRVVQRDSGFDVYWNSGAISFYPHGHKNVKLVHQWSRRKENKIENM